MLYILLGPGTYADRIGRFALVDHRSNLIFYPVRRARPGPRLSLLFFFTPAHQHMLEHVSGGNCTLFVVSLYCDANVNDDAR